MGQIKYSNLYIVTEYKIIENAVMLPYLNKNTLPAIAAVVIYSMLGFIIVRQYNESAEIEKFATEIKGQLEKDKMQMKEVLQKRILTAVKQNVTSKIRKMIMEETSGKIRSHMVKEAGHELRFHLLKLLKPIIVEESRIILRKDVI